MKQGAVLMILLVCSHMHSYSQDIKIEVEGAVKVGSAVSATPKAGEIRWNGSDFEGWNGSKWISFTEVNESVKDIDGNQYQTIQIGTQTWMAENLRTIKYNDGTPIPEETDDSNWSLLTQPAYCWFDNDSITNAQRYGALYNYYAVADTNSRNICPVGWDVPSYADWEVLTNFLGSSSVAGGKLKEIGFWSDPNTGATNESGFSALPAGYRLVDGTFDQQGFKAYMWTSSLNGGFAWFRLLLHDSETLLSDYFAKNFGYSVRCVKD